MPKTKTIVDHAVESFNTLKMYEQHAERVEKELHVLVIQIPEGDMAEYIKRTTPKDPPGTTRFAPSVLPHKFEAAYVGTIRSTTCQRCMLEHNHKCHNE